MIRLEPKLPGESRDHQHDWSTFLGDDTIASQTTTSSDLTVASSAIAEGDRAIVFRLSGGTAGTVARVTQLITTAGGNVESQLFTLAIEAAEEPVSVAEVKANLKIEDDDDDALIAGQIRAARAYVENATGHVLVRRHLQTWFPDFNRRLIIWAAPFVSIDALTYYDTDEAGQTYEDAIARRWSAGTEILPAAGGCWPALSRHGGVIADWTGGYLEGEAPEQALQAIQLLAGHWYENRETVNIGNISTELPHGVDALCRQIKLMRV